MTEETKTITIPLEWTFTREELEGIVEAALTLPLDNSSLSGGWIKEIEGPGDGPRTWARLVTSIAPAGEDSIFITPNEWGSSDESDTGLRALNFDNLRDGLVTMHREHTSQFALLAEGEWDDYTVDLLLQYSLYGDILFH